MEASTFILDMQTVPHGVSRASFVWLRFDCDTSTEIIVIREAVYKVSSPGEVIKCLMIISHKML